MTPTSAPPNAVSLLLALARKHSSDIHQGYRSLQNITALSSSQRKKHQHHNLTEAPASSRPSPPLAHSSSSFHFALASSSKHVVASQTLWQSRRKLTSHHALSSLTSSTPAVASFRYFSTGEVKKQKHQPLMPEPQEQLTNSCESPTPVMSPSFKGLETDFPCLTRTRKNGPEPDYDNVTIGYKTFSLEQPFQLSINNGKLPRLDIAYETWGKLNEDASNAVLVLAGLSASSHARSSVANMRPGWWEKFIGPGCAVDTNKFFVICPNNLGGCYGTSGPSSINVLTGKPYATTFPIIGVLDMATAIFRLLDYLGIQKLHGAVGSSLGGMLSLQSGVTFPERVGRLVTISSCAQSYPSSIAMRYLQRKCIMSDPNWNSGYYYEGPYPKIGMKLAREIGTLTYRSGPEWAERFGRGRITNDPPSLCPTFLIESYLEYQGESFSSKFDPNSLLYISKAMDLFDIADGFSSLEEGLARVQCPVMVIGVQTDILFPIWQQRDLANMLQRAGNNQVTFYELNSLYGHDTFLLDLNGVGAAVKGFLETEQREAGWVTKHSQHNRDRKLF